MKMKEGSGWKAGYNEKTGIAGAEVMFQGSWDLYEISASVFSRLSAKMAGSEAEKLIRTGRILYSHVNDRCGPPYNVILDEDYGRFCPWAVKEPVGRTFDKGLTAAAVELFASQNKNRERKKKQYK